MTADFPATDRCPTCGAAVRFGDPWCTLCYADLRPPAPRADPPPAAPETAPLAAPPTYRQPSVHDPLTAPLEAVTSPMTGPSWPCAACGRVNPMAADICSDCGRHFLAGLREESPLLQLPMVGDITRLSRGRRFAIALGVVLLFVVLTVLLGLVFR